MWVAIKEFLLQVLNYLYSVVNDYGVAIILLTVVVRLALAPLQAKQTKSMYQMQKVQPKIKELQKKYKDDKPKLQEETMKFYQENKVNPFGGCLPLILQMPIFFALFRMLGTTGQGPGLFPTYIASLPEAEQARAQAFMLFDKLTIIPNITMSAKQMYGAEGLTAAIPYIIFVVLFGLSIVIPQLMQPGQQAQQRQMGIAMGAMMLFFGWSVSAGVVLYWVTSSALGVLQQIVQTRMYKRREEGA